MSNEAVLYVRDSNGVLYLDSNGGLAENPEFFKGLVTDLINFVKTGESLEIVTMLNAKKDTGEFWHELIGIALPQKKYTGGVGEQFKVLTEIVEVGYGSPEKPILSAEILKKAELI